MKELFDHGAVCSFLLQMLTKILTNVARTVQIVPKTEETEIVRTRKMLWSFKSADNDLRNGWTASKTLFLLPENTYLFKAD